MNPLRSSQPEHVTEQDLLALHLNELPLARARVVRRILAQDPTRAAEFAAIAAVFAAVTLNTISANRNPIPLSKAILDRNWQAIRTELVFHTPVPSRWQFPVLVAGVLAATVAGITFLTYIHHPAALQFTPPKSANQTFHQNQPTFHDPVLTTLPNGQVDLHPREPGFRAKFSSGVYRPESHSPKAIRPIGLALQPAPASPAVEPLRQPPLTLLPQPSLLSVNPSQDHLPTQGGAIPDHLEQVGPAFTRQDRLSPST